MRFKLCCFFYTFFWSRFFYAVKVGVAACSAHSNCAFDSGSGSLFFCFESQTFAEGRVICHEPAVNFLVSLCCFYKLELGFCRVSLRVCDYFNNLSILQGAGKRNDFSVGLGGNDFFTDSCVNGIGKVDCCCAGREFFYIAFWREHINLVAKQFVFEGFKVVAFCETVFELLELVVNGKAVFFNQFS